jgi:predicted RNase H-like HicB family nuclease
VDATRTYTIVLEPAEEGGFIVHVPALPEVATCGDTEDEALAMARQAIELVLEHRLSRGEDIPTGFGSAASHLRELRAQGRIVGGKIAGDPPRFEGA